MARVSFGSRAGGASDYLTGHGEFQYRSSTLNGLYSSLRELGDALRREIEACAASELPELTTCELRLKDEAVLPLLRPAIGPYAEGGIHDLPAELKESWSDGSEDFPGIDGTLPKTDVASILSTTAGQPRQIVQRAASRALVQAIEATDGFKYTFNNAWSAKDEEGLRFSYICQDSMQNKDRHANGFHKTQKHLKGEGERGPRKPTYDCKGSISVKFSQVRNCVEVYYRHYAIHASVAERRAARLAPKPKKAPRLSGPVAAVPRPYRPPEDAGGLLAALQNQQTAYHEPDVMMQPPRPTEASNVGKQLKRKRDAETPKKAAGEEQHLSLADLLRQSEGAKEATPTATPPKSDTSPGPNVAPPIDYALPSWQAPPPPPPPSARRGRPPNPTPPGSYQPAQQPYGADWRVPGYAPPYQPQQYGQSSTLQTYGQPKHVTDSSQMEQIRQGYPRLPKQLPKAQGLFTTLKPVKKEEHTTYEPHFIIYNSNRAKTSCHHCRISKKKECDEGRPMCGACARSGKLDCLYETGAMHPPQQQMWQQLPGAAQSPSTFNQAQQPAPQMSQPSQPSVASSQTFGHSQSQPALPDQAAVSGGDSPDPWFPRR